MNAYEQSKIPFTNAPEPGIRRLICCCCGCGTVGRQWRGRDTGFGLCDKCADRIAERGESAQEMLTNYGQKGIHYKVAP